MFRIITDKVRLIIVSSLPYDILFVGVYYTVPINYLNKVLE